MQELVETIIHFADKWGYIGIILLMTLESCFIPFPSEIVMIPAGYLASKDELNLWLCILCGIFGSVLGALINYYVCYFWGKDFVLKWGKYFGIDEKKFSKFESFFNKHGEFSTFISRLIPGIRQYISLPAGLVKMKILNFIFFIILNCSNKFNFLWLMIVKQRLCLFRISMHLFKFHSFQ